jgi:RNA 2',3'-cyclic 3'-phosphodiesterase
MRTFVSIEIPDDIKKKISDLIEKAKLHLTPIKWVENKNLHVTLKFIGQVEDDKIMSIIDCVKDSIKGTRPFSLSFAGMGLFPDAKHPNVLWVGIDKGSDKAKELSEKIECRITKEGYRGEEKDFTAHLTIGRIKEKIDIESLSKFVQKNGNVDLGSFKVGHISIMKSTLREAGPIYDEIEKITLN